MNEEEARSIWLRAAELQAEAALHHERKVRRLGSGDDSVRDPDGLTTDMIRDAAVEAGIAPEFIDIALAEAMTDGGPARALTGWQDHAASRLLGTDERRIQVDRLVEAPPARVLEAMRHILPNPPYGLTLKDTVGDDPLDGGVLVFGVPKITAGYTPFTYTMATVDIRELRFTLVPLEEGSATRVSIVTSLIQSRRANWIAGNALSGVGAAAGGLGGLGIAKAAALTGTLFAAPIVGGTLALGALSAWGMRAYYLSGLRKSREVFRDILGAVSTTARLGPGFLPTRFPSSPEAGGGDPSDPTSI